MGFAVLIAAIALVFNCQAEGQMITLANGSKIPMKCYYTAIAEASVAGAILLGGVMLALSKTKEARRNLSLFGLGFGALVMLLPTVLIGVCANPAHDCNRIMLPSMLFLGVLVIGTSAWSLLTTQRMAGVRG
jgi:hypothetical protein